MTATRGHRPVQHLKRFFGAACTERVEARRDSVQSQHLADLGFVFDQQDGLGCHCGLVRRWLTSALTAVRILTGERLRIDSPLVHDAAHCRWRNVMDL